MYARSLFWSAASNYCMARCTVIPRWVVRRYLCLRYLAHLSDAPYNECLVIWRVGRGGVLGTPHIASLLPAAHLRINLPTPDERAYWFLVVVNTCKIIQFSSTVGRQACHIRTGSEQASSDRPGRSLGDWWLVGVSVLSLWSADLSGAAAATEAACTPAS